MELAIDAMRVMLAEADKQIAILTAVIDEKQGVLTATKEAAADIRAAIEVLEQAKVPA